jgi:hypothetical protein
MVERIGKTIVMLLRVNLLEVEFTNPPFFDDDEF